MWKCGQCNVWNGIHEPECFLCHAPRGWVLRLVPMVPERRHLGPSMDCPICFKPIRYGDVIGSLHCRHIYCCSCIQKWTESRLHRVRNCPECRLEFPVIWVSQVVIEDEE